jgi:hypothetical protein
MRVAIVAGLGASAVLVAAAAASPQRDQPLPHSGFAVATSRGVDLVGLDGRLRRSLPGYRFRALGIERQGQVELRDRAGRYFELRQGVLAPVEANATTLSFGLTLRWTSGRWSLARGSRIVERFPPGTVVELDESGTVLTAVGVNRSGSAVSAPVAIDLRTLEREELEPSCRVGAQSGHVRFELCGYPLAKGQPPTIVRVIGAQRRVIVAAPEKGPGRWLSIAPSGDGKRLLAQWSSQCEVRFAYIVDVSPPRLSALGADRAGRLVESRVIGWSGDAALVALPDISCSTAAPRPGIYAFGRSGPGRLVYRLPHDRQLDVKLWR